MNIYQDKKIIGRLPTMSNKQLAEADTLAKQRLANFDKYKAEGSYSPDWAREKIVHLIGKIEEERKGRKS